MAKRIFVATSGSRGDVEPFLALSKALQGAGYDVLLSVARHGAGPEPLPVKQWRADVLAERINALTQAPDYARRAREISARMAQENGLARALDALRSAIGSP